MSKYTVHLMDGNTSVYVRVKAKNPPVIGSNLLGGRVIWWWEW